MEYRYAKFWGPGHPLASRDNSVAVHRAVLYDAIGPGTHPCHWCGTPVTWLTDGQHGVSARQLVADHVDGDPAHNWTDNLVPACQSCNTSRNRTDLIGPDEPVIVNAYHGRATRAEWRKCEICDAPFLHMLAVRDPKKGKTCSRSCSNKLRWRSGGAIGPRRKVAA